MNKKSYIIIKEISKRVGYVLLNSIDSTVYLIGGAKVQEQFIGKLKKMVDSVEKEDKA